jgi:uncharacterized protein
MPRWNEVLRGLFWTAVVSRNRGLASTTIGDVCSQNTEDDTKPRSLADHSARQLAELALSPDSSDSSLGLAAINSLINIDKARVADINAGDLLIKEGASKDVAVIGHFPFTDALRKGHEKPVGDREVAYVRGRAD